MGHVVSIAQHPRYELHREIEWSKRQAANQLGVSTKTIERWVRSQEMPHRRTAAGFLRFLPSEVASWRQARTEVPT